MYQINKTLLQVLRTKDGYNRLHEAVKPGLFDKEIRLVLKAIDKYWRDHDTEVIELEVLAQDFRLQNQSLSEDEWSVYQDIFLIMQDTPDPDISRELIRSLKTMQLSKEVEDANTRYALGDDVDLFEELRELIGRYEADVRKSTGSDWCRADIREIIEDETTGSLLTPSLRCLANSIPSLRTGMQVIVAARPDRGKTSFCAELVTGFQRPDDRPIIWFNNEGAAIRIKGTLYRSALRKNFDQIMQMGWDEAGVQYEQVVGGRDAVQVYDIHGRDYKHLERIIEDSNPCCVVWDMLDNVRGFGNAKRDDQRLEQLYQWTREAAVIYDFLSIPTSQISSGGANLRWVPDKYLKESQTAKQGACDAIIMLGSIDDEGYENSRFIYLPKNKSQPKKGYYKDCRTEVYFHQDKAWFEERSK